MSKVGRNDPCPCGSGKKYKKCCEKKANVPFFQKKEIKHIQAKGVSSVFQNALSSQKAEEPKSVKETEQVKEAAEKDQAEDKKETEEIKKPKKIKAENKAVKKEKVKKTETIVKKVKPEEKETDKKD